MVPAEQVGHDLDAGVACVIQAGKMKTCFHRLEQREAGVVGGALDSVPIWVICVYCENDAVLVLRREEPGELRGAAAIVVLIPHDHDGTVSKVPGRGSVNRRYQPLDGYI